MKQSRKNLTAVICTFLMVAANAQAEEQAAELNELVVSANRYETDKREVGSSITVITAEELKQQQKRTVYDALRMVPGVDVARTGGPGGLTSVFMRGSNSDHTLVLLDGVELNSPAAFNGFFDFSHLTLDNVERIEILRGQQSTLYGSQAMGGVINIITKKGSGKLSGYLTAEGGSHYTARESAGISGAYKRGHYALNVSRLDTKGISAANQREGNSETDPYQNTTVATRLGIAPLDNLDFDLALRYSRSRADLDGSDPNTWAFGDLRGYYSKIEQLYLRSEGNLSLFDNFWEQKLGVSYNDTSIDHSEPDVTKAQGNVVKLDWQHVLHLHKTNDFTFGIERKDEYAKYTKMGKKQMGEKHTGTTSFYFQDHLKLFERWFTTLGVRVDDHERFGTKATYRFTSSYLIKATDTRLKGSYGTGFKAPTVAQLYHPEWGGNRNLKAEKSSGWDIGFEQYLLDKKLVLEANYFENSYRNLIVSDSNTRQLANISRAKTKGVELAATIRPIEQLAMKLGYTYLKAEDRVKNEQLIRRPKNKLSADLNYSFMEKANLNLGLMYVGSRYDTGRKKMGSYMTMNLAASYDVCKNFQIFGRAENLLNRKYEEISGYGTPGIAGYGGVKFSF